MIRAKRVILLAALIVLTYPSASHAQSISAAPLAGLKSMYILMEYLDEDAKTCGLTAAALDTSLRFILGQSRIQVSSSNFGDTYVYLQVTALKGCAITVHLSVTTAVTIAKTGREARGAVWSTGGLSTGPRDSTSSRAIGMTEQYAKRLVVDWNSVNQ
jgi:hypothetical protein